MKTILIALFSLLAAPAFSQGNGGQSVTFLETCFSCMDDGEAPIDVHITTWCEGVSFQTCKTTHRTEVAAAKAGCDNTGPCTQSGGGNSPMVLHLSGRIARLAERNPAWFRNYALPRLLRQQHGR